MQTPFLSVIMVAYNVKPYIVRAIESILSQKANFPFELLIGEDCSTDGTREIVLKYAEKYPDKIRVVTGQVNVGLVKNYYRTIEACRGQYIAFCDGDDYWHREDKMKIQVDYLESHHNCGLVFSDYGRIETGKVIPHYNKISGKTITNQPDIFDILLGNVFITSMTVMARRKLVERVLRDDPYLYGGNHFEMIDTPIWAELSLLSEIHYIDESLAIYNCRDESATRSSDWRNVLRFRISDSELCIYLCDKHDLSGDLKRIHERLWCRQSLQLAFIENRCDWAEKVKRRYPRLTLKDQVWYWGVRYSIMRPLIAWGLHRLGKLKTTAL